MVLEYFNPKHYKKDHGAEKISTHAATPVLKEEDEHFLHKITSQEEAPPLPERPTVILDNGVKVKGKDAQIALMNGADQIPLPKSPPVEGEIEPSSDEDKEKITPEEKKRRDYWSYLPFKSSKAKAREQTASDLHAAVEISKAGGVPPPAEVSSAEEKKEKEELASILDRLNLSAFNNKIISLSKDSEKIMDEFTQILKDVVNGVPTAYDDLEKLLTTKEKQLSHMYESMPPFLKTLIKSLPAKMTASLAPELLASASEKPGVEAASASPSHLVKKKLKSKARVPSLKSLVSKQGAVVTMLRSILNFLKLRFPAFVTGTNVLMSLAVFLLLFVFWYCHKRGKETRLENERLAASGELDSDEKDVSDVEDSITLDESAKLTPEELKALEPSSATVPELPSVLNLPDPKSVPLPEDKAGEELREPAKVEK